MSLLNQRTPKISGKDRENTKITKETPCLEFTKDWVPLHRSKLENLEKLTFLGSKNAFFGGSLLEPFKWTFWGMQFPPLTRS